MNRRQQIPSYWSMICLTAPGCPSRVMSKGFKRAILAISVLLVIVVFLGGFGLNGVRAGTQNDGAYRQVGVYEEVLHKIQSDYVVEPSIANVTNGALHGLLESLDADSSYLTPAEYTAYKAHANEGTAQIGLNISKRFGTSGQVAGYGRQRRAGRIEHLRRHVLLWANWKGN